MVERRFDILDLLRIQVVSALAFEDAPILRQYGLTARTLGTCCWTISLLFLLLFLMSPDVLPYLVLRWFVVLIELTQVETLAKSCEASLWVSLPPVKLSFLQFTALVNSWLGLAKIITQSVKEFTRDTFLFHSLVIVV